MSATASSGTGESQNSFGGVWTAIVTPFRADLEIDWPAFDRLLDHQRAGNVAGIVIAGTTGESPTLTVQEKLALIRRARAVLPKSIRIMAGAGDSNTQQSAELARLAKDAGADSLLVVTPPYNKPSVAGLINHYGTIHKSAGLPICLYHVPGRTAQFLTVDQLTAVGKTQGVACVKEASGDIGYFTRSRLSLPLPFLSGDDPTYLASLGVGGTGVISVVSNVLPTELVLLTRLALKGDTRGARVLNDLLLPFIDSLFCEVNPCPVKEALAQLGLCERHVRPPLARLTEDSSVRVKQALAAVRTGLTDLRATMPSGEI